MDAPRGSRPASGHGPAHALAPGDVADTRGGEATDEEVAAIVAAIEVTWPRPGAPRADTAPPRWRFSGRWWTKPVPLGRPRPW